jgi:nickel/cobalt exporter
MDLLLPVIAGFVLGCIHAFDADHVVAVTAFASKNPQPLKAARFGIVWGLGHTATLLVLGLVSIAFKFAIPPVVESFAELLVGVLLVAIGLWVLAGVLRQKRTHIHKHTHDGVGHIHFHSHEHNTDHDHSHSMFLVGATHGFAGTASVMILVPLAVSQSLVASSLYLLLFGFGTMVAMGTFAFLLGSVSSKAGVRIPVLQAIAGTVGIVIGFVWIGEVIL